MKAHDWIEWFNGWISHAWLFFKYQSCQCTSHSTYRTEIVPGLMDNGIQMRNMDLCVALRGDAITATHVMGFHPSAFHAPLEGFKVNRTVVNIIGCCTPLSGIMSR